LPVISAASLTLKDFSLTEAVEPRDALSRSEAVMYMAQLVMSWKQCEIATSLLQITNRKSYSGSCDDVESTSEGHEGLLIKCDLFVEQLTRFQLT